MSWKILYSPFVVDILEQLDCADSERLFKFFDTIIALGDPRAFGCSVSSSWRYFVDEFAAIAQINDAAETISVSVLYAVSIEDVGVEQKSHIFFSSSRYNRRRV
jgi:hypothetical protein